MSGRKYLLAALAVAAACWPRAAVAQQTEMLVRWPSYKEIVLPPAHSGLADVVLDREVLGHALEDQSDLRLYDASGKEVAYALRIRRHESRSDAFEAAEYDRSSRGGAAQISYDLGERPEEHNEAEIDTEGQNFRRRVEIQGGNDGVSWSTLISDAFVLRFESSGAGGVDRQRVKYPDSRYRFLRVIVYADPQADDEPPVISSVSIRRNLRLRGETQDFPALPPEREPTRSEGRQASAYGIDLEERVPLDKLVLLVDEDSFSRPYRLESMDEDAAKPVLITSGQLVRRAATNPAGLTISFQETFARRLRLTVIDDRNPPLTIHNVSGQSAARQVVFEAAGPASLRLYYGNPKATAPYYDFSASLPRVLTESPQRFHLGPERDSPDYEPEPKPLTERSPWLIYAVLGAASLGLLAILVNLVKSMGKRVGSAD